MQGQCGEMAPLATKVGFGAVGASKGYLQELTLMLEMGAVGCTAPGLFGPHLCLSHMDNERHQAGLNSIRAR